MRRGGARWWRREMLGPLMVFALAVTSCTASGTKGLGATPAPNVAAPRLYVAQGASETRGVGTDEPLREAWPQDLFRMLPANYQLVNLGVPDATLSDAIAEELPQAAALHPALVTVWLNANDVLSGVPTETYRTELSALVHGLRATGAAVLVANTPPLDDLPAFLACVDPAAHPGSCLSFVHTPAPSREQIAAAVSDYNAAIAAVAAQEGAVLVDLYRSGSAARASGSAASLVSDDGFNPNTAGAARIASQFAAVVPK